MRKLFGVLIIIAGVVGAFWLAIWVMLAGGIIQAIHAAQHHPTQTNSLVWGIIRAVFFEFGFSLWWVGAVLGSMVYKSGAAARFRRRSAHRRPGLTNREVERRWQSITASQQPRRVVGRRVV